MLYNLVNVTSKQDRQEYHAIRKAELFAGREYNEKHPDDYDKQNHPLLLRENGKAIGSVRLDFIANSAAVIRLLAVKKEKQEEGVGREFYNSMAKYAKEFGIKKFYVNAAPESIGYYEKLGFIKESWNPAELTGTAADCVQMSKIL